MKELKNLKYLVLRHNEVIVLQPPTHITCREALNLKCSLDNSPFRDRYILVSPDFTITKRRKK